METPSEVVDEMFVDEIFVGGLSSLYSSSPTRNRGCRSSFELVIT